MEEISTKMLPPSKKPPMFLSALLEKNASYIGLIGVDNQEEEEELVMLDLFSGSGSVGKVYAQHGFKVISVDSNRRSKPTLVRDVSRGTIKKNFHRVIFIPFLPESLV